MAKDLNKQRMRDTRALMASTIFVGIFCKTAFSDDEIWHESLELAGYVLITICAIGRIYSTAFIGGLKNENLITWGPYSLCRNPLYFFSLLGAAGIGLMSTSLLAFIIIFAGFTFIYIGLIRREEEFLKEKFGKTFEEYAQKTPRLLPSFKNYTCPAELAFQPKYLTKSVFDAIWWFVPYPLFEMADYLKETGMIDPFLRIF